MAVKHNFATRSNNVYVIDTRMFGFEHFNSAYLIKGKELALIDTGLAKSLDELLAGIKSHGFSVNDLSYVFCTHEHHDHCDNVGPLLRMNPNIKAYMHEKVKYALTNTEAIAEAMKKSVSPEQFAKFGKVEAVPPEKCNILKDGDVFDLGDGEKLKAIYAAGHQPGSYVFFAEKFGGLFINDLPGFYMADADAFIMNTPFGADMIKAQENLLKLMNLPVKTLFLGHFGISDKPQYVMKGAADFIQSMLDIGVQCVKEGKPDQIEPRTKALRLAQADKLKGIREPEMYNYVVTELIGRQCAVFAKYFLASGYVK